MVERIIEENTSATDSVSSSADGVVVAGGTEGADKVAGTTTLHCSNNTDDTTPGNSCSQSSGKY